MKDGIKASYEQLADAYEHDIDTAGPYNSEYERPTMMGMLPGDLSGTRFLDAGCAAGWYAQQLAGRGAEVTAIDLSPAMVEAARRRTGSKVRVLCHDLEEPLPFADRSFDAVLSSLTLHYLQNWGPVLAEFRRVLVPGGMLLCSVHHPFMDLKLSESGDYFLRELLTETWNKQGREVDVSFYRRPLQEIVNSVSPHFALEQMIEPQPTPAFKQMHPEGYERLMKNPHFLILKAVSRFTDGG